MKSHEQYEAERIAKYIGWALARDKVRGSEPWKEIAATLASECVRLWHKHKADAGDQLLFLSCVLTAEEPPNECCKAWVKEALAWVTKVAAKAKEKNADDQAP